MSSLLPPVGIIHGKRVTTVSTKQVLRLVTSQAQEVICAAVDTFYEGKIRGFYALEREEAMVLMLMHDWKLVLWQSQNASINMEHGWLKQVVLFIS